MASPPALEEHPVEIRPLSPVEGVALVDGPVVGLEVDDAIGAGAQGGGVLLLAGRGGRADAAGELGSADDGGPGADEGVVRIGRGRVQGDPDGQVVDGLHRGDAVEGALAGAARVLVGAVAPGEDGILGRHVAAVGPFQALFQLPRDGLPVLGDPAVLQRGRLGGQGRREVAVGVVPGQGFQGDGRGVPVLEARGEVGVEQGSAPASRGMVRTSSSSSGTGVCVGAVVGSDVGTGADVGVSTSAPLHATRRSRATRPRAYVRGLGMGVLHLSAGWHRYPRRENRSPVVRFSPSANQGEGTLGRRRLGFRLCLAISLDHWQHLRPGVLGNTTYSASTGR